ncbi:acyltransferase [Thermodesulfobacteriota bacterium B35]
MAGLNHPCIIATLKPDAKIIIGEGCGLSGTTVSAAQSIVIGKNVLCGANVSISDTDWHHVNRQEGRASVPTAPVVIGDNVWLAMNVVVLKGVTIGDNSVIGANSVVTKNIPANVLAAGQPAKTVRNLTKCN